MFNVAPDANETSNLANAPQHRKRLDAFLAELKERWDLPAIHEQVLASQQSMRNHIDLDDLERRARFPVV